MWWKINGNKKPREMKFLSRQTTACCENVSVWTERQTEKIENDSFRNARKRYRVHIVSGWRYGRESCDAYVCN